MISTNYAATHVIRVKLRYRNISTITQCVIQFTQYVNINPCLFFATVTIRITDRTPRSRFCFSSFSAFFLFFINVRSAGGVLPRNRKWECRPRVYRGADATRPTQCTPEEMYEVDIHFARNTHLETPPSLSSSVYLSFTFAQTHIHMLAYPFFAIIGLFLSFSFSLYIFLTLLLYRSIGYRNPLCAIYRSTSISREFFLNRPASFIAFRTFLPSSIPFGKCILIPKCISMHRVLLQGISRTIVSTAIDTP